MLSRLNVRGLPKMKLLSDNIYYDIVKLESGIQRLLSWAADLFWRCYQRQSGWCIWRLENSSIVRVGTGTDTRAIQAVRRASRTVERPDCDDRCLAGRRRVPSVCCTVAGPAEARVPSTTNCHDDPVCPRSLRPDTCSTHSGPRCCV